MTLLQQGNEPSAGAQPSETQAVSGFVMQIHGGQHDGRLIRVLGQKCTIGRAAHCTIQLASPEFQPLHCLLVRGQGGIVVRCWSQHTTLNGQEFSVSWMVPGDRLGIGSIELELLRPGAVAGVPADELRQLKTPAHSLAPEWNAVPPRCPDDVSQAVALNRKLTDVTDELARAQEFVAQLLEERQELLERLAVLQREVDGLQATPETADSQPLPAADWEAERRELQDAYDRKTQQLQSELQQAVTQRDSMHAIVVELQEEVGAVVQLRQQWYQEREQLQRRLDLAMLDRSAVEDREPPTESSEDVAAPPHGGEPSPANRPRFRLVSWMISPPTSTQWDLGENRRASERRCLMTGAAARPRSPTVRLMIGGRAALIRCRTTCRRAIATTFTTE